MVTTQHDCRMIDNTYSILTSTISLRSKNTQVLCSQYKAEFESSMKTRKGVVAPDETLTSKSERKREMQALQALAERLIHSNPQQWQQFDFSTAMLEALDETRRVKGHSAMRRHTRRLAKLLKHEDAQQVEALFERVDRQQHAETERFHRAERWRDRLLEAGDKALEELLDVCPNADRQQLRQLIRGAKQERERNKSPASQRKLFRYIKSLELI